MLTLVVTQPGGEEEKMETDPGKGGRWCQETRGKIIGSKKVSQEFICFSPNQREGQMPC